MYNGRANLNLLLRRTLRETGDGVKLYRAFSWLFFNHSDCNERQAAKRRLPAPSVYRLIVSEDSLDIAYSPLAIRACIS